MKKSILLFVIIVSCSSANIQSVVVEQNTESSKSDISVVNTKSIKVGMTKEMVVKLWGDTKYKFQGDSEKGKYETWYYGKIFKNNYKVVEFKNGLVETFRSYHRIYKKYDTGIYN